MEVTKMEQQSTSRQTHAGTPTMMVILLLVGQSVFADFTFGPIQNCGPIVNTAAYGEYGASISSDGLTLYFADGAKWPFRSHGLGGGDIWMTTRKTLASDWSEPLNLGATINSGSEEGAPFISADGLSLYFQSGRSGGYGALDLYVSRRSNLNAPWENPVNLGAGVNGVSVEFFPYVSPDGLTIYFGSFRSGQGDIFVATRTSSHEAFGPAESIGSPINTPDVQENTPWASPDGRVLFFTSQFEGSWDIFVSRRANANEAWGMPTNLGLPVSVPRPGDESGASFTADGKRFFFYGGHTGSLGHTDLWEAEAFPVVDFNGDDLVDSQDMSILVDHWHTGDPLCDIGPMPWGDGIVDEQDLKVLSEYLEPGFGRIAHWKLDETEGDIAYDSVGSDHANVHGSAVWQPETGVIDGALELDGTDDYIAPMLILNPMDRPFRIIAWIKGGAPGQVIASQTADDFTPGGAYLAADSADGTLVTELLLANMPLDSGVVITDGEWHEVGLEWDGQRRHLLVDAAEAAVDEVTLPALGSEGYVNIGTGPDTEPGSFWSGLIDEVRVYEKGGR
jgi:hypothetical protein